MRGFSTLRLLTWNLGRVHFTARINRWLGLDSRASDGALGHVARLIDRSGADLVALQELRRAEQLERLASLLGGGWRAATPARVACDRRVGLLLRSPTGPAAPVFEAIDLRRGRSAQAVSFAGSDGEPAWAVASLHLDAFDDRARNAAARQLLAWTAGRSEAAVVLAGDLNLDLSDRGPRRGADGATRDALAASLLDVGAHAGATALLGRRVDCVMGRGVAGRAEVLRGVRVPLGDHDPVLAHLLCTRR